MDRDGLVEAFRENFLRDPEIVTVAPGRVNLIGEHTDYNEGFVFPVAIARELFVAARVTDGPSRLKSLQMGDAEQFDAMTVRPGHLKGWGKYAAGMAWAIREVGKGRGEDGGKDGGEDGGKGRGEDGREDRGEDQRQIPNVQAIVHSEVPIGTGVSSSAALEMAFGVLFNEIAGLGIDSKGLARLAQKDENHFVGVKSGIMDQMASAMGKEGHALFLDTRSLDITYAPLPDDVRIVLCDTQTPRSLTSSAYNERRAQCEEASRILGVPALRDASLRLLEDCRCNLPDVVYRRARHVITENERCRRFKCALDENDSNLMGEMMRSSHESLRDDYDVSSRELNQMAEACWNAPGCIGARMTGAGFGGACVALVERARVESFMDSVNLGYERASKLRGELLACRSVDGARVLSGM